MPPYWANILIIAVVATTAISLLIVALVLVCYIESERKPRPPVLNLPEEYIEDAKPTSRLTKLRSARSDNSKEGTDVEIRPSTQHRPISAAIAPLPPPPKPTARPFSPLGEQAPPDAVLARVMSPERLIRFQ